MNTDYRVEQALQFFVTSWMYIVPCYHSSLTVEIHFAGVTMWHDLYGTSDTGMAPSCQILDELDAKHCNRDVPICHH